jgi:hypothetical protein
MTMQGITMSPAPHRTNRVFGGTQPTHPDSPCFKNRIVLFQLSNGYPVADRPASSWKEVDEDEYNSMDRPVLGREMRWIVKRPTAKKKISAFKAYSTS